MTRQLNKDKVFTAVDGSELRLTGRSLLLVRNVGHLMQTDAVIDKDGNEVFEGLLDAVITAACAMANTRQPDRLANSQSSSVYIVNDNTTPYKRLANLTTQITDSTGATLSGRYYSLVLWICGSEGSGIDKLYCNLPSGSYNSTSLAL